jgi:hypothetical protein
MSVVTVEQALAQLPLTRLTHFTPALNLWHIIGEGMIRSSKDLADHAPDCFTPTDRDRYDQHPDMVCCNFQYPNPFYLEKARQKAEFLNYPDWVCLLLDARLVLKPGTLFCGCNAAKAWGRHAQEGGQALLDCYAPVAKPMSQFSRRPNHHPAAATDLQAEALIPGPVDLSYMEGIVTFSDVDAHQVFGDLNRYGFRPERFRWVIAPDFFDKKKLSNKVQSGAIIVETAWHSAVDQESN